MASGTIEQRRKRRLGYNITASQTTKRQKITGTVIDQPAQRRRKDRDHLKLQHMPHHILEQIFLGSENVNFPRSTPLIGWRLSGCLTFVKLIAAALGPTWDQWFGCLKAQVVSYHGWNVDAKRIAGNPNFQSAVFACRQMKVELILDAYDLWYASAGAGRPYSHSQITQQRRSTGPLGAPGYVAYLRAIEESPPKPRECWNEDCKYIKWILNIVHVQLSF
jgi:hypothetical protein